MTMPTVSNSSKPPKKADVVEKASSEEGKAGFRPPRWLAIAALVLALIYGGSPVDALPEALLGPLGLADDAGVLGVALWLLCRAFSAPRKD